MRSTFKTLALAAAALLFGAAAPAQAQEYPEAGRPIRFIVGFPPGSSIDNVSRVVLDHVRTRTGTTIVVENRPGALGVLGVEAVARAPADGYTMMPSSSATHSSGPYLSKAAQKFDALEGFSHVGRMVRFDVAVVASAAQGYTSAKDLVAAAKAKPRTLAYGYGSGTGQVVAAAFSRAAGIQVLAVPYKGQPLALTDLIGGQVHFVAADLGAVLPQIQGRNLVPLVLASSKRSTILPNVPTAQEAGLGELDLTGWIGVAGPARLPVPVVRWWATQLAEALAAPEVRERLRTMGMEPDPLAGEALQQFVRDQHRRWGLEIQSAGMQPE